MLLFRNSHYFLLLSFTLTIVFFTLSVALRSIVTSIIVPTCALPILRQSDFCSVLISDHLRASQTWNDYLCRIPLANQVLCPAYRGTRSGGVSQNALSQSINNQFAAYQQLVTSSSATPAFGREIREIVLSLDDMTMLLKATSLQNKDAIISHLATIRMASRESARRLQKYTSKLMSSITLILTASEFAIEVAHTNPPSQWGWVPWSLIIRQSPDPQLLQNAFLHTIKTFETLNRHLTHLNGETQEAISILDAYVEVLVDLIYDGALVDANRELGDILACFWTQLGGYRTQLVGAREKVRTLERVGQGSRLMRAFVLDVQLQLERLQTGAEELRAQAAEPLLIDSPIPVINVIESLKEGCKLLRTELWSSNSQAELGAGL